VVPLTPENCVELRAFGRVFRARAHGSPWAGCHRELSVEEACKRYALTLEDFLTYLTGLGVDGLKPCASLNVDTRRSSMQKIKVRVSTWT
jgi:hypothetical protein